MVSYILGLTFIIFPSWGQGCWMREEFSDLLEVTQLVRGEARWTAILGGQSCCSVQLAL